MKGIARLALAIAAAAAASLLYLPPASAQMTGDAPLTPQERANEKVVVDFWREVLEAQNPAAASKFYAPDVIQHNPNVPSGLQGFQEFFGRIWKTPKPVEPQITPTPTVLMVKGDLVLVVEQHTAPDPADSSRTYNSFWFDLFRVKNGKIVEHWDNALKRAPRRPE
jgi:predicted SnoaL-like aldol condensation-catalyzing enzyme